MRGNWFKVRMVTKKGDYVEMKISHKLIVKKSQCEFNKEQVLKCISGIMEALNNAIYKQL